MIGRNGARSRKKAVSSIAASDADTGVGIALDEGGAWWCCGGGEERGREND